MNPYLSITIRTFTIWIMAAVVNGILCGIYLGIIACEGGSGGSWMFAVLVCSLFFSIPGFLIFWMIMLFTISAGKYGRNLFRTGLSALIVLATVTAYLSFNMYSSIGGIVISGFIILSPVISIMMHFHQFKQIGANRPSVNTYNQNKQPQ